MEYLNELKQYTHILENENFKKLNNFIAHGKTTTLAHSINVTKQSIKISKIFNIKINQNDLIVSALLHDLFFYDWHHSPKGTGLHGFTHAKLASENAKELFNVSDNIVKIIKSHMWPLNITKVPTSKEAIIVCIADKICAVRETLRIG